MNYPIYAYNNTELTLVFPDIGLEIPSHDFFQISNEDVLEEIYYDGTTLFTSHQNSEILFTIDTTTPPNINTIIPDPYYASDLYSKSYYVSEDLTERDSIPLIRRRIGIKCYVIDQDKEYRLVGGIQNSDWEEVVYVDFDTTPGVLPNNRFRILETVVETSSTNFISYDSWVAEDMTTGTYLVRWFFNLKTNDYRIPGQYIVNFDGERILDYTMAPSWDGDEEIAAAGVTTIDVPTDGNYSFEVLFRRDGSEGWVQLRSSYLELIKVV
jgi:hypothetical protein